MGAKNAQETSVSLIRILFTFTIRHLLMFFFYFDYLILYLKQFHVASNKESIGRMKTQGPLFQSTHGDKKSRGPMLSYFYERIILISQMIYFFLIVSFAFSVNVFKASSAFSSPFETDCNIGNQSVRISAKPSIVLQYGEQY